MDSRPVDMGNPAFDAARDGHGAVLVAAKDGGREAEIAFIGNADGLVHLISPI